MSTMLRLVRPARLCRGLMTQAKAASAADKPEGDISSVFASLSGVSKPLPERFISIKDEILGADSIQREKLEESWQRLIKSLEVQLEEIAERKSDVIPILEFGDLSSVSTSLKDEIRKRGSCVIRNVVPEQQALQWKERIRAYAKANPGTKAYPPNNPQVYELYWSSAQLEARGHPAVLDAQRFVMNLWKTDSTDGSTPSAIFPNRPVSYVDRLRIRQAGDTSFALGPHVDGGGVERWEDPNYRALYKPIWDGEWEKYDPFSVSGRLGANMDMYNGAGACSMFRMFQGWLSISTAGAFEGTLLVLPLVRQATAYFLLRPFFAPPPHVPPPAPGAEPTKSYLRSFRLLTKQTSELHGATPGMAQELSPLLHPHLRLDKSMTHMPTVRPGDYVAWHCDGIHAVDTVHKGNHDSSVLYIPSTPLCEMNATYLKRQREAFLRGTPPPDFPGGVGESNHVGRGTIEDAEGVGGIEAVRAMGMAPWSDAGVEDDSERVFLKEANRLLGF